MDQIIKENSLKMKSFCKSINVHVPLCIKLIYLLANNNFFFLNLASIINIHCTFTKDWQKKKICVLNVTFFLMLVTMVKDREFNCYRGRQVN